MPTNHIAGVAADAAVEVETTARLVADDPPVVARLVVEIRSNGTTTIARGGLTDVRAERTTVIEAHGSTPLALALSLSRHLFGLSSVAARAARALLGRGGRSGS